MPADGLQKVPGQAWRATYASVLFRASSVIGTALQDKGLLRAHEKLNRMGHRAECKL